jgi:hypothetical protein
MGAEMSAPKFASITSSLLARKGEAEPWRATDAGQDVPWPARALADDPITSRAAPKTTARTRKKSATDSRDKTCAVHMTHHDYERLGIMAVKKGTSRQRLMQLALEEFFGRTARDYASECACLLAGPEPEKTP